MIRTDDPRLSAYALGELPPESAMEVERLLEGDAEAVAAVEDLRAMAATLATAFGAEPAVALTQPQRAAVVEAAAKAAEAPVPAVAHARRRRAVLPWLPWSIASAAAAAGLLALIGPITPRTDGPLDPALLEGRSPFEVVGRMDGGRGGLGRVVLEDSDCVISGLNSAYVTPNGAGEFVVDNSDEAAPGLNQQLAEAQASRVSGRPGLPAPRLNPIAGGYWNDGRDGDFRGRTESIFERPLGLGLPGEPGYESSARGLRMSHGSPPIGDGNTHLANLKDASIAPMGPRTPGQATNANWNGVRGAEFGPDFQGLGSAAPSGVLLNLDDVTNGLESAPHGAPPGLREPTDPPLSAGIVDRQRLAAEAYAAAAESPFLRPTDAPLSTFSIDVDTASYANVRRMLTAGVRPPPDAVRLEELVNYFPYAYPAPTGTDPFAVHLETAACPWNLEHRLVRVALKGREIARKERPASNLVFLVDVSGSMDAPAKLPLVKASLRMLVDELNERDTVAIVTYAGASGVALQPTTCEKKDTIREAIDRLTPGGSTNGAAGIELAYQLAAERFVAGGVNRVILATDGDFNVGVTSHDDLLKLIEGKAKSRIFLTTLGYGMGNLKDSTLEMLADKGNGTYGYIDTTREAHKLLVEEAGGTLVTIAKDVKVQVEFNPKTVGAYRLVGYDNRLLAAKDFADDTKDAGEIGAGHTVTAFYEVVPAGKPLPRPEVDPLRYQPVIPPASPAGATSDELLTVKLRWKAPEGDVSTLREIPYTDTGAPYEKASADFRFAASVASFALVLRGSPHRGTGTYEAVLELAGAALGDDPGGWRKEFVDLVGRAKTQFGEPAPLAAKTPPPAPPTPPTSPPTAPAVPATGPVQPPR